MKTMLRKAAEGGYDKIGWVTGEQTAERYDLAKRIKKLEYYTDDHRLVAYDHHGASVINKGGIPAAQLPDYIGKDAAEKLLANPVRSELAIGPFHELSGQDLKIGGEWAKNLYDRAIPHFLSKYGKKWGAKVVGDVTIGTPTGGNISKFKRWFRRSILFIPTMRPPSCPTSNWKPRQYM